MIIKIVDGDDDNIDNKNYQKHTNIMTVETWKIRAGASPPPPLSGNVRKKTFFFGVVLTKSSELQNAKCDGLGWFPKQVLKNLQIILPEHQ